MDDRERIAERFDDAGLSSNRFVSVVNGEKRCLDHAQRHDTPPPENYGIYATANDPLVLLDIDDYDDHSGVGVAALEALPPTLEQATPHGGTHRAYVVRTENGQQIADILRDEFGKANLKPSWGEVRVINQYVVGAGSQLDGCDKDGCEECSTTNGGQYTLIEDRALASVTAGELVDALSADPNLSRERATETATAPDPTPKEYDINDRLEYALNHDDKLQRLWNDRFQSVGYDDRSSAEYALACKLTFWFGKDKQTVRRLMNRANPPKWAERDDDSYRDSVLEAVDVQDETYSPGGGQEKAPVPDGRGTAGDSGGNTPDDSSNEPDGWVYVRQQYQGATTQDSPLEKNDARFAAAEQLLEEFHFANREDDDTLFVYDADTGIYRENGESVIRQRAREGLQSAFARQEVGELAEHIRAARTFAAEEFGGPEWYISVTNGVLRIDPAGDVELLDHDPEYLFVNQVAAEYDPDAECLRWRQYLEDAVKSERHRLKLQEYAGYCLLHWGLPEHKALFLVGPQASGKSTFADTVRALLGGSDNVASMSPQQMTGRFGTAELFGTWANIRNDIPPDAIQETGAFKEIVAGDPIKAERKGKPLFHFRPTAKHVFSANQLPDADTDDGAFYRRILLVPFPTTIPREQRDKHLDDKLCDELPGILNWALDGLFRLLAQDGFTGDLSVHETAETWDKWGSTVDRFAKVCLKISADCEPKPKSEVYALYQRFCDDESFPAETQRRLTRRLKTEHGVEDGKATVNGRQQRCFLNIKYTPRIEQYRDDGDSANGVGLDDF